MIELVTQPGVIEFDKLAASCKLLWPILLRNSNTFDNDTCKISADFANYKIISWILYTRLRTIEICNQKLVTRRFTDIIKLLRERASMKFPLFVTALTT